MLLKTRGILLRAIKYSETSLILDVYTREKGLKKYIVSGVRKNKARMHANLFQVMSILDLVAYDNPNRDLNRIKEAQSAHIYQRIPFEVPRSAIGLFLIEVTRKAIHDSEPNPDLFDFLEHYLTFLDQTPGNLANIHLLFLIQFSAYLGIMPDLDYHSSRPFFDLQEGQFTHSVPPHSNYLDEEEAYLLHQLIESDLTEAGALKIKAAQRKDILGRLLDYFHLHLDHFSDINSHHILGEILG
jgi:DNA repair protein RecO (recombination protein O)